MRKWDRETNKEIVEYNIITTGWFQGWEEDGNMRGEWNTTEEV